MGDVASLALRGYAERIALLTAIADGEDMPMTLLRSRVTEDYDDIEHLTKVVYVVPTVDQRLAALKELREAALTRDPARLTPPATDPEWNFAVLTPEEQRLLLSLLHRASPFGGEEIVLPALPNGGPDEPRPPQ